MRFVRYTFVCLSGVLLAAGSAAAQQQQTPPPPPPPPVAAQPQPAKPAGPTRSLTIDEAVELALKNNLGLQIERLNPQIQQEFIASARAAYLPTLQTRFVTSGSTNQPSDFTQGSQVFSSDSMSSTFSFNQPSVPWTNTRVSASWSSSRTTTGRLGPAFNPDLNAVFSLSASQPLWRNLFINPVRNNVQQAVISRQIADVTLRQRVVGLERQVRSTYWALVGAIERLKVAQQNLDLSNEQLRANRVRVEVGTMAPIDIIAAQAEVASNEEAVIVAQAAIQAQEDALRTLILDPNAPDFWTTRIAPSNEPVLLPMQVNTEAAIQAALEARTDIVNARRQLQISDLSLKLSKNSTLPDLTLDASVVGSGSGGTRFFYVPGRPTEVESQAVRSFSAALGDAFGFVFPRWSLGVNYSYPIGKEAAQANHARALLQRRQDDANLKSLEISIVQQVRSAARNVTSNFQRVQSTRVARELAEQRLDAQRKRFDVGLSTLFELTQAQRDVVAQRNAELNAVLQYNQSLVDFQLVQVAPLGGF